MSIAGLYPLMTLVAAGSLLTAGCRDASIVPPDDRAAHREAGREPDPEHAPELVALREQMVSLAASARAAGLEGLQIVKAVEVGIEAGRP